MADKPYEVVEDDMRHRRPAAFIFSSELFMVGKILFLLAGGFLGYSAFSAPAIQAGPVVGLACLCGIAARICQAEEQFRIASLRAFRQRKN